MQRVSTIIEAIILILVCGVSSLGNATLFFVFTRKKHLRTISNGFLLNLAFADLLVSLLNMPITVVTIIKERWIFGDTACVFFGFITMLSFVSSVMSLAMIAINRYYYVVQWKNYTTIFTTRKAFLFAGVLWLITVLLSTPPLFGWAKYRYIPGKSYCFVAWPSNVYYMYFMIMICFCGPLLAMSLSYFNILKFTKEAARRVNQQRNNIRENEELGSKREHAAVNTWHRERNKTSFKMSQEEIKLTNTLLIVVACFMACWAPFVITMFLDVYSLHPLPRAVDLGTLLLGYANSMCNPMVYGIRNPVFRRELASLFSSCTENRKVHVSHPVVAFVESKNRQGKDIRNSNVN